MDCEYAGKPSFEERMRTGPIPKVCANLPLLLSDQYQLTLTQENWLASARVTDQLFSVLKNIALQRPLTPEMDLPTLKDLSISEDKSDQTEAEKEAARTNSELLKVAMFMAGSKTTTLGQADKALGLLEDYMNSKKKDLALNDAKSSPLMIATGICLQSGTPIAPTWRYLHSIFTLLETVKAMSQLVALASKKASKTAKLPNDRVDRLSTLVGEVFELVRSNTRVLKQRTSASGVLGTLVDLVMQGDSSTKYGEELQAALESAMDGSAVEMFVGSLMESWEEALDGVMGVKL